MNYLVPDYYPAFACKCGDCRSTCCHGWAVTISKDEYQRLCALECTPDFRRKLDAAVNVRPGGKEDTFGHMIHDREDNCLLLREDGLCDLHRTLGEGVLPDVCRLYPRNPRSLAGRNELACSASCEAVTEKLMEGREALGFVEMEIPEAPRFRIDLRPELYPRCLRALEILSEQERLSEGFTVLAEELFDAPAEEGESLAPVRMLHSALRQFAGKNRVAGTQCIAALEYYGDLRPHQTISDEQAGEMLRRYREGQAVLRSRLPHWDRQLRRLLLNHMFYNNFPHVGGSDDGLKALYGLSFVTAFVNVVLAGCTELWENETQAVDLLAPLFRLIEHSDFKYRVVRTYRELSDHPGNWLQLVKYCQ